MTPPSGCRTRSTLTVFSFVGFFLFGPTAPLIRAQGAPDSVSFQGMLTNAGGTPINTTVSMTFKLYKNGTSVWTETQPSVVVTDGIFNVLLGSVTPLDTVAFNRPIEIGIKVGADPEISPKTPLAAAPFALGMRGMYAVWADNGSFQSFNVIGGAPNNSVGAGLVGATIGGGGGLINSDPVPNTVGDDFGTVGGGLSNTASGIGATVGGGDTNAAGANVATVSGGVANTAGDVNATVGGGHSNTARGAAATVGGGGRNVASGQYSTVPGGHSNRSRGEYSFSAGQRAVAKHNGTFVWNDASLTSGNDSLVSTDVNQFIVRAVNGIGFNKAPGNAGIHLKQQGPSPSYGIRLEFSSDTDFWETWVDSFDDYNFAFNSLLKGWIEDFDGSYVVASDARLKHEVERFGTVLENVIQLRPSTYRFKDAPESSPRSMGLLAQEVEPLFPELISEKDDLKGLNYAGLSVVAIKAIQELHALVQAQQDEIEELRALVSRP